MTQIRYYALTLACVAVQSTASLGTGDFPPSEYQKASIAGTAIDPSTSIDVPKYHDAESLVMGISVRISAA